MGMVEMPKDENDNLIIDIERILIEVQEKTDADHHHEFSIYRVPAHIRKKNECYYEPRSVSIGPYHRKKEHLLAMEHQKALYLTQFINQKEGLLLDCLREIRNMEADIRACYFESVGLEEGDQFVKMMLFDSCFIIQFFINWHFKKRDAVRDAGWALPLLMGDLLMLANQIPFFVLIKVYNLYTFGSVDQLKKNHEDKRPSFITLAIETLHDMHKRNEEESAKILKSDVKIKHLLHLFYLLYVPDQPEYPSVPTQINDKIEGMKSDRNNFKQLLQKSHSREYFKSKKLKKNKTSPRVIPSAIELKEYYGVKLRKKESFKSFLDVSFKDGILEVPRFFIEEHNRSIYLNLIAFEQCCDVDGRVEKTLSSYAAFMACLVNMAVDVIELEKAGILENNLANSKEGAKFFHQLRECAHVDINNHYLKDLFVEVIDHCQAFWPKHRAELCRNYFSSPWTLFSLMAALLVLAMNIFNTICYILTTFLKKN